MNTMKSFISFVTAGILGSFAGKGLADTFKEIRSDRDRMEAKEREEQFADMMAACKWRAYEESHAPYLVTLRNEEIYQLRGMEDAKKHLMKIFPKSTAESFIKGYGAQVLYDPRRGHKYIWLDSSFRSNLMSRLSMNKKIREKIRRIEALKTSLKANFDKEILDMAKELSKEVVEIFYQETTNVEYKIGVVYKLTPQFVFDFLQPSCYSLDFEE